METQNQVVPQNQYYRRNRDKVLSRLREKYTCECGAVVNRSGLIKHMTTTTKHTERMKKINDTIINECLEKLEEQNIKPIEINDDKI